MSDKVYLAEEPFVSIQGEGPNAGTLSYFIRFSGCNLRCPWCDTPHALKKTDGKAYSVSEISEKYHKWPVHIPNVVLTGGEPFLQFRSIIGIINSLVSLGPTIEIETNGTLPILSKHASDLFQILNVNLVISPKFHTNHEMKLIDSLKTRGYFGHHVLKFVYEGEESEKKILEFVGRYPSVITKHVYVMPEGVTRKEQLEKMKKVASFCIENGFNFSSRLQILLWGNTKRT